MTVGEESVAAAGWVVFVLVFARGFVRLDVLAIVTYQRLRARVEG